jgi:hypothetical protein
MVKYNPCGIFLDIISPKVCFCDKCAEDMKKLGMDINDENDRKEFAEIVNNLGGEIKNEGDDFDAPDMGDKDEHEAEED